MEAMEEIAFEHYSDMPFVRIRKEDLIGVFTPKTVQKKQAEEEIIMKALESPIQSQALHELAKGKERILILADDNTRTTPTRIIIPIILEQLKQAGVDTSGVALMVALGTHREMTPEETRQKFGHAVCQSIPIYMHRWDNEKDLRDLGTTERGTAILVNKQALEADFVIGVGQIVPHRVAGYSGGCKIIQPGICGAVTTGQTHWLSAKFTGTEIMGRAGNPVREEMNRVGLKAGLAFIVNTVSDLSGEIAHVVCGDPIAAYREGARLSGQIFGVEIPKKADIVLTDSYPADLEMWQASKGIYAADLAVKEGGVIVMVSPCDEGICAQHPDVAKYGYLSYNAVQELVSSGELTDLTVAAHLVHVGRVVKEKARGILVSPGIGRAETEKLGFLPASDPQEGLEMAFEITGRKASVSVLKHGGHILPLIRS